MKLYKVVLSKSATKELKQLPDKVIQKIIPDLKALESQPRPHGCKKLHGPEVLWRIRVGVYRIIYAIDDRVLIIDVRRIGHRKEVYR